MSRRWTAALAAGTLTQVACTIGTAFATAMIVRAAPAVALEGTAASTWSSAVAGAWLLGALFGVRVLAIHGAGLAARVLARRVDQTLRERMIAAALLPSGIAHFEDPDLKGAFSSARNLSPLGLSPGAAVTNISWCFGRRLEMVCFVVVLAFYSWPIAFGMSVVFVLGNAEMYRLLMTQILNSRFVLPPAGPAYYRDLSVLPAAAKEVRVFGLREWLRERYSTGQHVYLRTAWNKRRFVALSTVIALGASGGMTLISLTYFGLAAIRGSIDGGDYTLLVLATFSLTPPAIPQDVALVYGTHVLPQITRAEAIAHEQRLAEPEATAIVPHSVSSIAFRSVSFRYPNASADVLCGLDLELRAGEVTALVGVNGVGKTTLIKLLCGFHRPSNGHILIDGVDSTAFERREWYPRLAVLFQDFVHYEMSARDNVEIGHTADGTQLASVAAASGALGFVERLPGNWSTPLASHFDGGADLSGGEWQRLALARALAAVERGARVLVLDEPAASLDVRAESALNERLVQFAHATTQRSSLVVLVVSHRLSTVRRADRIVVLDDGGIVEDGTHDQLVGLGGRYAALFAAQAARYRADAVTDLP